MVFLQSQMFSRVYLQGIGWMLLMCIMSNSNDIIMKFSGSQLPTEEVSFFRFFFSVLILMPFITLFGKKSFHTQNFSTHFLRGFLLFIAMTLWAYAVPHIPLSMATTLGFTTPFFVLPLAKLFLNERINPQRWYAVLFGFVGTLVAVQPFEGTLSFYSFALVVSVVGFALLDVLNKRMLSQDEPILPILFYSALVASMFAFIPAYAVWVTPTLEQIICLVILGAGANLTLYCLLQACKVVDVSSLQPFRYFELVLSILWGFILFNEIPTIYTFVGGFCIICSTLYLLVVESKTAVNSGNFTYG